MKSCIMFLGVSGIILLDMHHGAFADLTGEYLFEEGAGSTANDSSGFARHGTLTSAVTGESPSYAPGLYKGSQYSLVFDRENKERVDLPSNTDFIRNAPGATIMAWVRVDEETTYGTSLFPTIAQVNSANTADFNGYGGSRATITNSHNFGFRSVGSRISEARNGANSGFCQSNFNCPIEGTIYFVAGVFDYVHGTNAVFINGLEAITNINIATWNGNSHDAPNLFASIGASPDSEADARLAWLGAIDGVRIYNEALSPPVILDTYNAEVMVPVDGDYNRNGVVDAADYVLWRHTFDEAVDMDGDGADGNANGVIDQGDYDHWRARFGSTGGSGNSAHAIPEPAAMTLGILFALAVLLQRRAIF